MKDAKRIYNTLLKLYPHRYRKEFGAQMMQTFIDNYTDVEKSEGYVSMFFWLSTVTDEIKNILEQQRTSLRDKNTTLNVTVPMLIVLAALFLPLYAVFFAALVKVSLTLPHPPMSGIGVAIALTALLVLPGVVSMAVSYALASALASVFQKRKVRVT